MDYGDYSWGLCRGYYRDPFPNSLLSARQFRGLRVTITDLQGYYDIGAHTVDDTHSKEYTIIPIV